MPQDGSTNDMSGRRRPGPPATREQVAARVRGITRAAALTAVGATVGIGIVVAHQHSGAASQHSGTTSSSGSTATSSGTNEGSSSSDSTGTTGTTGNTGGASTAPSISSNRPSVTSGGTSR